MTTKSALENVLQKGLFGDYENKNKESLIKISEIKDLLIVQIVQYKSSKISKNKINIGGLFFSNEAFKVNCNNETRVLWCGPNNWLLISKNKDLLKDINQTMQESDFAITDLSHSRAIIQLEGKNSKEVLKKGCPFNFDILLKNNCVNSVFNGITISVDMINDSPDKIRVLALRSFGESLYHSLTDACLEFGYTNN